MWEQGETGLRKLEDGSGIPPGASSKMLTTNQRATRHVAQKGAVMPKKTSGAASKKTGTSRSSKTTGASKNAQASASAAKATAAAAEEKRKAREAQETEQQAAVVKRAVNGDEKVSAVAKDLKITPGKAAFLIMKHRVSTGDVPAIKGKDDEALLNAVNVARLKADEYSSWGWLAARSGRSEGFIKDGLAKAGLYSPRATNIATSRANARPAAPKTRQSGSKTKTSGSKSTGAKKVRGNA